MTIKYRLIIVLSVLLLVAFGIGFLGMYGMQKSNQGLKSVYENRTKALADVSAIDQLIQRTHLAITSALLDPTEPVIKAETALIERNIAESSSLLATYRATELSDEEAKIAERLVSARSKLIKDGFEPAVKGLRDLNLDGTSQLLKEKILPMLNPVNAELRMLRKVQVEGAKAEYDLATARYRSIRAAMLVTIVLAAIATALVGMAVIRTLYRQLGGEPVYSGSVVRNIAAGDLTEDIEINASDTTSLLFAMKSMQAKLASTVTRIRATTELVAIGSNEIANGNIDLSNRTEQQANSIAQTAASLHRLTETVKINVENARQINNVASEARHVAVLGGEVVSRVVTTMSAINDSAKKITDIISVINGIAFQTNILALNAAVEAARAGEQGRGFAVVAAEVRSLAQRSAEAAKEIKSLIEDSSTKTQQGTQLANEAGKTMDNIQASVKRVSDLMVDITAASEEQASGIEQANQAVMEMDDVTQQNAALVQQAAAAATSLKEQADALAQDVAFFKVDKARVAGRAEAPMPVRRILAIG